ncbi:hypothetical protein DM01DRAFT_1337126 [Hesseltinella vesiculosa]|uniref:Uncharacterized protein n=1 Tax=Hesseltinella vesiculosa TaxID=101127 RepID=A0A1X2GDX4_9FUNG|nr:hypothetical protein DM01DRAFT_1337126 [Hesseltinella vesiculosa]
MKTKGPAFEIRFCDDNKVQVFDLSNRGPGTVDQRLPNEYREDDVRQGRLRYSKLGNQWAQEDRRPPYRDGGITYDEQRENERDVIPVLARQRQMEDAKEQQHILEGEEAVRKAMERKERIAMAKRNRDRRLAEEQQAGSSLSTASTAHTDTLSPDQDPSPTIPEAAIVKHHSQISTTSAHKPSIAHELSAPATPLPNRRADDVAQGHSLSSDRMQPRPPYPDSQSASPAFASYKPPMPAPYHASQQPSHTMSYYQPPPTMTPQLKHDEPLDSFFHQDADEKKKPASSGFCCC